MTKNLFLCLAVLFNLTIGAHVLGHNKERVEDAFGLPTHYDQDGHHNKEYDHEAILGSKKAVHEYDELPPEEAQRRLRVLVTQGGMDKNNDGFVDRDELSDWIRKSFQSLTAEEAEERFSDEDTNSDGLISWSEHVNTNFDSMGQFEDKEEMITEDKELWKAADLNSDGFLNKEEFAAFILPEEHSQMHDALYEMAMERKDLNKDGFLDFNEFMADTHGDPLEKNTEPYLIEKERFERDYDTNNDGKMNKSEVLRWIIPDFNETVESEVLHLLENSDDNKDGKLSIDEIAFHHETFVGSEATNFGDHLHNIHQEL